jgi:DNA-directed RNA polymerase subunit RPC12/RpoP
MLEDIKIYICTECGKKTTGRKPPTRCNKCGKREFSEEALFEKRPKTTETHDPLETR